MIAEKTNAGSVVHRNILAHILLVKNRSHRGNIFMTKPQIDTGKTGIARLDLRNPDLAPGRNHVPGKDLFRERHRTLSPSVPRDGRQKYSRLHPSHVEGKQPDILDELLCDLVFPISKLTESDFLSSANPVDQGKVR